MEQSQQWWQESPEPFAAGFTEEIRHITRLDADAHHTAFLHDDGTLVIQASAEAKDAMRLTPEEAYNLLVWLHDNHRDRLYQLLRKAEEEKRV